MIGESLEWMCRWTIDRNCENVAFILETNAGAIYGKRGTNSISIVGQDNCQGHLPYLALTWCCHWLTLTLKMSRKYKETVSTTLPYSTVACQFHLQEHWWPTGTYELPNPWYDCGYTITICLFIDQMTAPSIVINETRQQGSRKCRTYNRRVIIYNEVQVISYLASALAKWRTS